MALIAIIHVPDHTTVADIVDSGAPINVMADHGRLVGLFDYPHYRLDLKCKGNCVVKQTAAWTRDPRGFMKCAVCGSRNRRVRRWLIGHLFDLLGANLINDDAPAAFRTPDGYGPRTMD